MKVISLCFVKYYVLNFLCLNHFNTKYCYWNKKNLKGYFISFENIVEVKLKTTLERFRDKYKTS